MVDENKFPLICLIILVSIPIISSNDPKCGQTLSNKCQLKSYYCNYNLNPNNKKSHFYLCDKLDANFQFDQTEMNLIRNCSSSHPEVQEALNEVYLRLSNQSILDGSFDLLNNDLFLTSLKLTLDSESLSESLETTSSLN